MVMPVYNERDTVNIVIDDLLSRRFAEFDIELLIVESNSVDGTRQVVERYRNREGVRVLLQERALGKGAAVRLGLEHVSGEIVLIQDADCEYDISDYPRLVLPLLSGQADIVLGNRGHHSGAIRVMPGEPWSSRVTNLGHEVFTFLFNLLYRQNLRDPFTMYKVFKTECIEGLRFTANRFDFDWELLGKICRRGYVPLEIPISYSARGFNGGKKVRFIRDPLSWIVAAIRYRLEPLGRRNSA